MTVFIVVFSVLLVINALLLIFSSSVAVWNRNRSTSGQRLAAPFKIYPLKSADGDLRKAV